MKKTKSATTLDKLSRFFGSRTFFYIVIGFFVFEALWFVFSAIYPMAFDENVHFGIIQIYGDQWSPFLAEHPAGAEKFGAITRDPSFLFHYLMSFPYRLLTLFTDSQTIQVIGLRLLNVAMFTSALVLYAKVMRRARASRALIHISLALFVLIPIAPQLAAHINYDNLFMLLVALLALSSFDLIDGFKKQRINAVALLQFIAICLAISLVKYAALPLVVAAAVFLLVFAATKFKGKYALIWPSVSSGFAKMSRLSLVLLVSAICLMSVSFVERYGYNLVHYKTPVPACDQVLTIKQCTSYGPWNRDYNFAKERDPNFSASPFVYMPNWLGGMWHRLFFAINGNYMNYHALTLPSRTAIVLAVVGFGLMIFWARRLFSNNPALAFLGAMTAFYIVILWLEGFQAYGKTGRAVAVNGRYFLPILLFIAAIMGRAFSLTLRRHQQLKPILASVVLLLFLHGGGLTTFILRSDETWYWPNDLVIRVNNGVRKVLAPVTIEGSR